MICKNVWRVFCLRGIKEMCITSPSYVVVIPHGYTNAELSGHEQNTFLKMPKKARVLLQQKHNTRSQWGAWVSSWVRVICAFRGFPKEDPLTCKETFENSFVKMQSRIPLLNIFKTNKILVITLSKTNNTNSWRGTFEFINLCHYGFQCHHCYKVSWCNNQIHTAGSSISSLSPLSKKCLQCTAVFFSCLFPDKMIFHFFHVSTKAFSRFSILHHH